MFSNKATKIDKIFTDDLTLMFKVSHKQSYFEYDKNSNFWKLLKEDPSYELSI